MHEGQKLTLLKKYLRKPKFPGDEAPHTLVDDLHDYFTALNKLEDEYNKPADKRRRQRNKLRAIKPVTGPNGIGGFAHEVRGLLWAMETDPYINAEDILLDVAEKLPLADRLAWRKHLRHLGGVATLGQFCEWIGELAQDYKEPGAGNIPPTWKKGQSDGKEAQGGKQGRFGWNKKVNANAAYNPQPSDKNKPCGACGKGVHELWKCEIFKKASVDHRWTMVKRNASCWACLNRGHGSGSPECKGREESLQVV